VAVHLLLAIHWVCHFRNLAWFGRLFMVRMRPGWLVPWRQQQHETSAYYTGFDPGFGDQRTHLFRSSEGCVYSRVRAESQNQNDAACEAYKEAYALKPKDPKYMAAYLRSRASAAAEHMQKGQLLRDKLKLEEALVEFQRAAEIDRSNMGAQEEMSRTATMLKKQAQQEGGAAAPKPESPLSKMMEEVEGPVDLEPFRTLRLHSA